MGKRQPPRRRLPFGKGTGGMTWEYEGNAGWLPKDPYRPPSGLPKGQPGVDYKVTADDVITAVLIGGGLAVADEVALITEAAEIAYRFNQYAKKSESEIGTVKDIYDWIKDNVFTTGADVPVKASDSDGPVVNVRYPPGYGPGRPSDYIPGQGSNIYPGKVPPGFNPADKFSPSDSMYPGKFPPGYGPGRGAGSSSGARGRQSRFNILSSRFEKA